MRAIVAGVLLIGTAGLSIYLHTTDPPFIIELMGQAIVWGAGLGLAKGITEL